jgi:hypothetical protein
VPPADAGHWTSVQSTGPNVVAYKWRNKDNQPQHGRHRAILIETIGGSAFRGPGSRNAAIAIHPQRRR